MELFNHFPHWCYSRHIAGSDDPTATLGEVDLSASVSEIQRNALIEEQQTVEEWYSEGESLPKENATLDPSDFSNLNDIFVSKNRMVNI